MNNSVDIVKALGNSQNFVLIIGLAIPIFLFFYTLKKTKDSYKTEQELKIIISKNSDLRIRLLSDYKKALEKHDGNKINKISDELIKVYAESKERKEKSIEGAKDILYNNTMSGTARVVWNILSN